MFKDIKKIVVLEPHLDDFEIGCWSFLQNYSIKDVEVFTFCRGRNEENFNERLKARIQISEFKIFDNFKKHLYYDMKKPNHLPRDTELTETELNSYCQFVNGYFSKMDFKNTLILVPQSDLHPDHCIINKVGKVLTRNLKNVPILEYIVPNSKGIYCKTQYNIVTKPVGKKWQEKIDTLFRAESKDGFIFNNQYNLINYTLSYEN